MKKTMRWLFIAFLFLCPEIYSKTYFLSSVVGNDSNDGSSLSSSFRTFSKFCTVALSGDTVFCEGVFTFSDSTEFFRLDTKGIIIDKSISIFGLSSINKTVFQGDDIPDSFETGFFTIDRNLSIHLKNLIFRNAYMRNCQNRGTIFFANDMVKLIIDSCDFIDNHIYADYLNAVAPVIYANSNNEITITNCLFRNNVSENTGVGNNVAFGNSAVMFASRGKVKISNSTFHKNRCQFNGATLNLLQCNLKLENCTFFENVGGNNTIYLRFPFQDTHMINNTFVKNVNLSHSAETGVVACNGSDLYGKFILFKNNLFVNNISSSLNAKSTINLFNTTAIDKGYNCFDTLYMQSADSSFSLLNHNIIVPNSNSLKLESVLNSEKPWDIPTLRFDPTSILCDAGDNAGFLNYFYGIDSTFMPVCDSRGVSRDVKIDIGAWENTRKTWKGVVNNNWDDTTNWIGGYAGGPDVEFCIDPVNYTPQSSLNTECSTLTLKNNAKAVFNGNANLTIHKQLNLDEFSELISDGILSTDSGLLISVKINLLPGGWKYISFPFDVGSVLVLKNDTLLPALRGNPLTGTLNADYYIAEYNALRRATENVSNGNWKFPEDTLMVANKGYIITSDFPVILYFKSGKNAKINNTDFLNLPNNNYVFDALYFNQSWNFKGNPYLRIIDLESVIEKNAPLYFFNGVNYQTVAFVDSKKLNPFEAFMFQAYSEPEILFRKNTIAEYFNAPVRIKENRTILTLRLSENGMIDSTRILLSDNFSQEYEIGKDAFKLKSPLDSFPQLYTFTNDHELSFNCLSVSDMPVALNIKNNTEAKLSLSTLDQLPADVWLYDQNMIPLTNLIESDYTCPGTSGTSLYYIGFNELINELKHPENQAFHLYNNTIKLSAIPEKLILYDIMGTIILNIYNPDLNEIIQLPKSGIYFLVLITGNKSEKYKILNN